MFNYLVYVRYNILCFLCRISKLEIRGKQNIEVRCATYIQYIAHAFSEFYHYCYLSILTSNVNVQRWFLTLQGLHLRSIVYQNIYMNGCVVYFNVIIKIKPQILESRCTRCVNGECTRRGKISLKPKIICLHDEVSPHNYFRCFWSLFLI